MLGHMLRAQSVELLVQATDHSCLVGRTVHRSTFYTCKHWKRDKQCLPIKYAHLIHFI